MLTDLSLSLVLYGVAGRGDSNGGMLGICIGVVGILLGVPNVDEGLTNSSSSRSRTGVLGTGGGAGELSRAGRGVIGKGDNN